MFDDNPFAEEYAANAATPHGKLALSFAESLRDGDFASAHGLLSENLQVSNPPERLQRQFKGMIEYGEGPVIWTFVTHIMDDWPDKGPDDVAWVYVALGGDSYSEGITMVVAEEKRALLISKLEWGRP